MLIYALFRSSQEAVVRISQYHLPSHREKITISKILWVKEGGPSGIDYINAQEFKVIEILPMAFPPEESGLSDSELPCLRLGISDPSS